ncbi:MAG TPA: hypothetical protein VM555_11080 [Tahibacter sp.]|jgi:hypothetical protein|nr:hypothetical protein [Tahibacter sp.]
MSSTNISNPNLPVDTSVQGTPANDAPEAPAVSEEASALPVVEPEQDAKA